MKILCVWVICTQDFLFPKHPPNFSGSFNSELIKRIWFAHQKYVKHLAKLTYI